MCKEIEPCCTPVAPPWETPQVIPAQLRRVNNLIFRRIGQISRANGVEAVTPMHGWIMEYLYRNSDTPVFQRDIEREFSITRSTVTNILQLMERKGSERRAGRPPQAAGAHRKGPPVPRKYHARPPPDRRIRRQPADGRREHRAAAAAE